MPQRDPSSSSDQAQSQQTTRDNETKGKWTILSAISLGTFMTALDGAIVNIALPSIANAYGVALNGQIQWVVIGYLVVIASLLLSFGRLADTWGAKRVWSWGIVIFTASSAANGLAPGLGWLIAFRAVQGVGAAMMFAPSAALIMKTFPGDQRGRALGINAVVVSLAVSAGPVLGGVLTDYLSWRWVFFANVPVGLVNFFWTLRVLPSDRQGRTSGFDVRDFDVLGAALFALGLGGLTLGLSFGRDWGWGSTPILGSLALGTLSFAAALFAETRVKRPLVDLTLFKNRTFASAFFSLLLGMTAFFSVGFLMPFYFEQLRGFSTARAGLLLTPMSVAVGVVGPLSGSLADRIGSRLLSPLGLAVAALGLLMLSRLDASSALWFIILALALGGIGRGIFFSPNTSSLMGAAPGSESGMASGLLAVGRTVGQALSIAVMGAVFGALGGSEAGSGLEEGGAQALEQTFTRAFGTALTVAAGIAALAFVVSLLRGEQRGRGARSAVDSQVVRGGASQPKR